MTGITRALTSASNTTVAGLLEIRSALVRGKCLSDAGSFYSPACSHITEARTVTLPGRHLSCLTTVQERGSVPVEGDKGGERLRRISLMFHSQGPWNSSHLQMSFHFPLSLTPQRAKVQGVESCSCRTMPPHPFYHLKPQVQCWKCQASTSSSSNP